MPEAERSTVSADPQSALMRPSASAPLSQAGISEALESQPATGWGSCRLRSASPVTTTPNHTRQGEAIQAAKRADCPSLAVKVRENMSGPTT